MNMISQILQGIGYLLLLVILAVLWSRAVRQSKLDPFWGLFALAWTMSLFGNVAWVIHDLVTEISLGTFSAVDIFYVFRYLLIGIPLWMFPKKLIGRNGIWVGITVFGAIITMWIIYFNSAMAVRDDWLGFLGVAMYPVLDAALIVIAWLRFRADQRDPWRRTAFLLFCAMISYGIANTLNFASYAFSLMPGGILPNIFWILTDVIILIMALGYNDMEKDKE